MKDIRLKKFIENAIADHLTCRQDKVELIVKDVMESLDSYATIKEFRASGEIGVDPVDGHPAVVYLDRLFINFEYKDEKFSFVVILENDEARFDDIALAEEYLYDWYLDNA